MDNLNRLVEALKKKALQAGKAGVNFVNKAPAAVGKYGSEKIIQPKIPQYKLAYNNFVKPAVKSTYEASKPILNYLDPRGYSKDDSKKLGGAMRAAPSTAFNAYGLTQLAKQPAFSVANYGIGGAFNVLAGDKKKPLAQRFTEGGRQGMEIAPKLAAIGSFSNPLIARGVNKASSLLSNPIAKQVVGRTATGIANIPEGMLMKKGITNAPYTPSDAAFDFGMGAVGGVPNGKVRVKGVTNNIKGIHPEDMKEISEIYKRMKVNYTFKGAANSLKGAIDLKAKDASLINNLYKQHIFNGAGVDKISFEDKVQQLFDQAAYDFRNRTPAFGLMAGNQAKGYNQAPNKFSSLADKKPRFEIDDSVAKLTKAAANRDYYYPTIQKGVLSEYLDHPKLYKEYPELQNAKVSFIKTSDVMGDGSRAAYDPKSNRITVNTDWINKAKNDDVKSTLLHEIQHAIQEKEGFARGGNIQPLTKEPTQKQISGYLKSKYNELIKKGVPEDEAAMTIQDDIEPYVERNMMHDNYLRLSGEIEARDVQSRMNLSPDKRLHTQPYASQGIPLKDQIVRFDGGTAASKGFSKAEDIKAFKTHILTDANLQRNLQELTKDGITPDANGLVTLYRGHSKKGDGVFRAFSYFTTNPKLAQRFGRNVETVLVNPKDLVITNRMGEGITFQNPVNLVKGNDGIHRIEPSNVMASIDNPQLRTSVPKGSYTNDPMIDNPLLSPRPKTDIKNQIKDLRVQARKSIEEQRMEKNVLKQELERFTTQDLQDFAAVRKMANSKAGQEGDIETLYKKNPKLMTKALERIREVYKNVEYDQEAFEKLMSLPKKSDTYVVKPNEYTKIQELKERLKTATDMVYHAEPNVYRQRAIFRNQEYRDWSATVFKDTAKLEKETLTKNIDTVVNAIKGSFDTVKPTPKQKIGIFDLFRTPDRVLNKIGLAHEAKILRTQYEKYLRELPVEIERITKWSKQVSPESNKRIFAYLDGKITNLELTPQELKVSNEIKMYLSQLADKLNLPKDKRITNYITHIFDKDLIQKEFDPDFAKIIQDKIPGSVYDPFTEKRLGKLGYKEDTWAALDAYVKRAVRKFNMDPALARIKNKAEHLEDSQYQYVKGYIDRINMRPTKWDNLIDNTIKQIVGYKFGVRPTTVISQKLRQTIYRATLGLNIGSALKNLTQGANTYAKLGEKYTVVGYTNMIKGLMAGDDELVKVGILADDIIQDRTINATKKFWENADKGLFVFFNIAEKINRGAAYYGAKSQAIAKGMNEERAIQYAKKLVRDTQFTFGSIDTPAVLQSDLAKTALQFQSFNVKQAEFLTEMAKKKDFAGMARWAGASLGMVYTVGQLIGMDPTDLIPFYDQITGMGEGKMPQTPLQTLGSGIMSSKDVFSEDESTRNRALQNIERAGALVIPGGSQIRKTLRGLEATTKGYSESLTGRVQYPVAQTPGNTARAALFGKSNLPEAQQYFNEERSVLGEKQSEVVKGSSDKMGAYESIISKRESDKSETAIYSQLQSSIDNPDADLSILSQSDPKIAANAVYRHVMNQPKEEQRTAYQRIKGTLTAEIQKEIQSIYELEEAGYTRVDRDLMLVPAPQRARAIYDRIMALSKDNRGKKYEQLKQAGLITPEVEMMIRDMVKKN